MVYHFWYILIHVGLGLSGYQYFTWTNEGGLLAAVAAAVVQGYAVWEIYKQAMPRFDASLAEAATLGAKDQMRQDFHKRLLRVWFFRTCIYALLTMIVAMIITA